MIYYKALLMILIAAISMTGASCQAQAPATPSLEKPSAGMNLLEQTSQAFTRIAKTAMPATVFIKVAYTAPQQTMQSPFDFYGDEFFKRFFGGQSPFGQPQQTPQQQQPQQIGSGSGFLISSDGSIVTNYHVIKDASQITVILNDGREFPATVTGSDQRTDLAVLKIAGTDFPFLSFGDSDILEIGEWVVAIGSPFALESSLTVGVVSAKGRQDLGIAAFEDFIQTDAAINPGNSGGPLLNLRGEVIGVNTAIMTRSGGSMGIGLTIPSNMTKHAIDQIVQTGIVKRAYLGIVLQPVDKDLAEAMKLDKQEGILISEVIKGSPAEKGGLAQGDIILSYNERTVKNVTKFRNDIALMNPDSSISLKVLRGGKPMTLSFSLGSQKEGEVISAEVLQKLGIEIENLTPDTAARLGYSSDTDGIVITKVKPGSPAAMAGLRPSFLITGVAADGTNQKKIRGTAEFDEALQEFGDKKLILLIVRHQNYQRYYTLRLQ